MPARQPTLRTLPGLALCSSVTAVALAVEQVQVIATGRAWLEALVLAILFGTVVRTLWKPSPALGPGIHFASKTLLEGAVVLMGASVSFSEVLAAGAPLLLGIVTTVFVTIAASFLLGRAFGLPTRMALLIACGNSICGNSAIAAVAPVIGADSDDVATAIAFTAVLGIAVVLALPVLSVWLGLSAAAGGALAGLTVYAVPQVLAAASPMGATAIQIGTLVKVVRVLMLGPVVTVLSLLTCRRSQAKTRCEARDEPRGQSPSARPHLLPGFIVAFLAMAAVNSLGLLPDALVAPTHAASKLLTVLAMAGLGLDVDLRSVTAAGPRVSIVVTLSILLLGAIAVLVLRVIGLG